MFVLLAFNFNVFSYDFVYVLKPEITSEFQCLQMATFSILKTLRNVLRQRVSRALCRPVMDMHWFLCKFS